MPKIEVFDGKFSKMGKQILINIPLRFHAQLKQIDDLTGDYEFDIIFTRKNKKNKTR